MKKPEFKNSIQRQLIRATLIPLTIMAIVIVAAVVGLITRSLYSQIETELKQDAALAILMYDEVYDGDFVFVRDDSEDSGDDESAKEDDEDTVENDSEADDAEESGTIDTEETEKNAEEVPPTVEDVLNSDKAPTSEDIQNGNVKVYKGDQIITGDNIMLDDLADALDIDISLFYDTTRVLTTLKGDDNTRATGTEVSSVVEKKVLESGEAAFFTDVLVYDTKSFAYYEPLTTDDGTVYGMVAVSKSSAAVQEKIVDTSWPIVGICIFMALFIGYVITKFTRRLGGRITQIDGFMNSLANGNFDASLDNEILKQDDELKHLARDGRSMATSIKKLVEYDALTGIYNRRYTDRKLAEIMEKTKENGADVCISIGDIDFFKKVNDTYGHEMGDIILKAVASTLKEGMVGKGFVARWGGEEFLLIFDNMGLDEARVLLESILEEIRGIEIPDTNKYITMSFGLTKFETSQSVDNNVMRADNNLYEAKETGRNQIVTS